jgi:antitoxin component YwqK of YwqJK toxin-antitoxin module
MKEIKLLLGGEIHLDQDVPVCLGTAIENLKIAHQNGSKIIWSTLVFEKQLEQIILKYFFEGQIEKMKTFKDLILCTNWFSVDAKRKFLIALINKEWLLEWKNKDDFEKYSKRITSLRNAFAHWSITEKSTGTFIIYFEGHTIEDELNDTYWDKVVEIFDKTRELIQKIEEKLSKK